MPIYEYLCPSCDVKFDRLQPSGSAQAVCPDCGMPSKKALSLFSSFVVNDAGFRGQVAGGGCPGCAGGGCACAAGH